MLNKDISKSLIIKELEQLNQNFVVNGQPQMMLSTCICCPSCNKAIINFGKKVDEISVQNFIDSNYDSLSDEIHYCVNCGQKIHFNKSIIVNVD